MAAAAAPATAAAAFFCPPSSPHLRLPDHAFSPSQPPLLYCCQSRHLPALPAGATAADVPATAAAVILDSRLRLLPFTPMFLPKKNSAYPFLFTSFSSFPLFIHSATTTSPCSSTPTSSCGGSGSGCAVGDCCCGSGSNGPGGGYALPLLRPLPTFPAGPSSPAPYPPPLAGAPTMFQTARSMDSSLNGSR